MPAAWEIDERPKLLIGMPHRGTVSMDWALAFRNLQVNVPAMFTTSKGTSWDMARNEIVRSAIDAKVDWLFFLDSVPGYTPIMVRDPNTFEIDIKPISELTKFNSNENEIERLDCNLEVFNYNQHYKNGGKKWTKITKVIRHPFKGELKNILTPHGNIHISKNHSIYKVSNDKDNLVHADSLIVGDKLSMVKFEPIEIRTYFLGREDLAWLYGFFAAEGSVTENYTNVRLSNTNLDLIEKSKNILEDYFNRPVYIGGKETYYCEITNRGISRYLRSIFYTDDGKKRVPKLILNAPTRIKKAFLDGYNAGDGTKDGIINQDYHSFTTNSHTLALGLEYLLVHVGQELFNISHGKNNSLQIDIPRGLYERIDRLKIKEISDISYDGYLYDIATDTHTYCAGVGNFWVHNTDISCPPDIIPRLMAHNLPICGALYHTRAPPLEPTVWQEIAPSGKQVISFKLGEMVKADFIGMGACLIHMSVFKNIPKPFFKWTLSFEDPENPGLGCSEDFYFCKAARKRGYSIFVDTSIVCRHGIDNAFADNQGIQISQI